MSVEMFVDVATDVSNGKFPWFRLTGSLVAAILVLKIRDLCTFIFAGGCAIQLYRNQWYNPFHTFFYICRSLRDIEVRIIFKLYN